MEKRAFKNKVYQELARIVKAMSNPHRLEILELLAQGSFSVEEIANETDLSGANASQHLQVLKRAQLVDTKRDGNYIFYQLGSKNVYRAWNALRDLGVERIAEVERIMKRFRDSKESVTTLSAVELLQKMKEEDITIVDVRPEQEFREGHIAGALNIPVEQLEQKLDQLSEDREIVAYCRGPFCVFADEAVALLKGEGFDAKRLVEGFPEWMLKDLPVEISPN